MSGALFPVELNIQAAYSFLIQLFLLCFASWREERKCYTWTKITLTLPWYVSKIRIIAFQLIKICPIKG